MTTERQTKAQLLQEVGDLRKRLADYESGGMAPGGANRFVSALDHILEGCQIIGRDWTYLYLNDATATHGRRAKNELLGRTMMECYPGIEDTPMFATLERCMRQQASDAMENEFTYPDGSVGWFELRIEPVPDGLFILSLDITRRKRDEAQIRKLTRMYALLSATNHAIVHSLDLTRLLQEACSIAVDTGGYRAAWIGTIDGASGELRVAGIAGEAGSLLEFLDHKGPDDAELSGSPIRHALADGLPAFDVIADSPSGEGQRGEIERALGYRSCAALPLIVFGKPRGVLGFYSDDPAAFDGSEVRLLKELATDLAFAMELAEKEIQRARAEAEVVVLSRFPAEDPNPVLRVGEDGGLLYANEAAMFLLPRWELAVGRSLPPEAQEAISQAIAARSGRIIEVDQDHRVFSIYVAPVAESGYANLYGFDTTELRDRERALRDLSERFRSTFEQAAVGMAHVSPDGRWLRVNRRLCEILGYSKAELLDLSFQDLTHPDEIARGREIMAGLLSGSQRSHSIEKRYIRKDRSTIWANLTTSLVRDADGTPEYFISVIEDVSERKRGQEEIRRLNSELEERVRHRTAQLQALNEELEAFSYSVSHDLRAPLRGIDGWSLALLEDYSGQLDGKGREYLDRVRGEAQRMGVLIDDLLQLSRLTRSEMRSRPVSLTDLAQQAIARLRQAEPERQVEVTIQPDLEVDGDATLLEVVLSNLLGNAWKFTSQVDRARIEFGRRDEDGQSVFFVRDNGAGFDMAYADKLFGVFQRLHRQSEFPGTGIGLATVQRIIRRHGGSVWAESGLGAGSTFYFTIQAGR